mgnify:CR=1 FL=1
MDIKEYSKLIKAKRKELDGLMKRKMPVIAGRMAKDHFQDNFRREGFVNGGLHPWPKAKRLSSGRTDAAGSYGTLLSGRNHLFSSVKYMPGEYRVRVANELVYAPVNNWGGEVHPTVTPQMRRFAWAKYYQASGKAKKAATGKRKGKKKGSAANNEPQENQEALKWKRLALTKKKKLRIKIPQRQFIGESRELSEKIDYTVQDGNLVTAKDSKRGAMELALTKNHIVTLDRDVVVEGEKPKGASPRDPSTLPHSLFIYDYELNLTHILNMQFPILRICGDSQGDVVYAIVLSPEYKLIQINISSINDSRNAK